MILTACETPNAYQLKNSNYSARVKGNFTHPFVTVMSLGLSVIPDYYYGYSNKSYDDALRAAFANCRKSNNENCWEDTSWYGNSSAITESKPTEPPAAISKEDKEKKITAIRTTCISFGYKEGTEKYADCMKDLYIK